MQIPSLVCSCFCFFFFLFCKAPFVAGITLLCNSYSCVLILPFKRLFFYIKITTLAFLSSVKTELGNHFTRDPGMSSVALDSKISEGKLHIFTWDLTLCTLPNLRHGLMSFTKRKQRQKFQNKVKYNVLL